MIITKHKHITVSDGSPVELYGQSLALNQLVICCSNAGTAWVVRIEDEPPSPALPAIILPAVTMVIPSGGVLFTEHWDEPLPLEGGLSFITVSGTAGVADIWFSFVQPSTTS